MASDSLRRLLSLAETDDQLMAALRAATTREDVVAIARRNGIELDVSHLRADAADLDVPVDDAELADTSGGSHPKYGTFSDECL